MDDAWATFSSWTHLYLTTSFTLSFISGPPKVSDLFTIEGLVHVFRSPVLLWQTESTSPSSQSKWARTPPSLNQICATHTLQLSWVSWGAWERGWYQHRTSSLHRNKKEKWQHSFWDQMVQLQVTTVILVQLLFKPGLQTHACRACERATPSTLK